MSNIRDGLIQLGFYRTMYAEDQRSSIQGVYDGTYKNVFMSVEIFANGYIARVEEEYLDADIENYPYKNFSKENTNSQQDPLEIPMRQHLMNVALIHNEISSSFTFTIRSEVLSMLDILHSLDKLVDQIASI